MNALKRGRATKKRSQATAKAALRSAGSKAAPKAKAAKGEGAAKSARRMLRDVTERKLGSLSSSSTRIRQLPKKRKAIPMTTTIHTGGDVVTFLKGQHQQIKKMLERVTMARSTHRSDAFVELRRMLAVHETAEEEIVHPAARRSLPDGEAIVERRLREENEGKRVLAELETLDVDSPAFETKFHVFKGKVLAHAESEEHEEFDRLAGKLDAEKLERMRKAVELAESVAPTRPHPGIESQAANLLVGPFASMVDRARDAIAGKGGHGHAHR
jgi:hemerythrin superfamily protein